MAEIRGGRLRKRENGKPAGAATTQGAYGKEIFFYAPRPGRRAVEVECRHPDCIQPGIFLTSYVGSLRWDGVLKRFS